MSLLIPISAVDGGEWSASHSSHFTPAVSIPITNKLGCCVGLRNCGCFADKKKTSSLPEIEQFRYCPAL
jgi:hypothetical protein